MNIGLAVLASLFGGAILGLVVIFGGVQAITPSANPASASDTIVTYDAR